MLAGTARRTAFDFIVYRELEDEIGRALTRALHLTNARLRASGCTARRRRSRVCSSRRAYCGRMQRSEACSGPLLPACDEVQNLTAEQLVLRIELKGH